MDDDRLKGILEALNSSALQQQLANWLEQRDLLRDTLREFWQEDNDGSGFKKWWDNSKEDIRTAMVLTALEDLPNSLSFAALTEVVCPELLAVESLLAENGKKVGQIFDVLIQENENSDTIFSFASFSASFPSQSQNSPALKALKLARSCILLQFSVAILLVFNNDNIT